MNPILKIAIPSAVLFIPLWFLVTHTCGADKDEPKPAVATATPVHEHKDDHADEKHDEKKDHDHAHEEAGHSDEVKLTSEAIQRHGIEIGTVTNQVLRQTFVAPARVAFDAEAMAHVGSSVQGRAIEIRVKVGDNIKKGDELLVIESPELGEAQSDFLQKRTAVSVAESAVDPVKESYDRAKKLYDQSQGIALGEVQKRLAEFRATQGALQTAQATATAAENKLYLLGIHQTAVAALLKSGEIDPKYAVRAPISGQVIEREVTLGELVSPEKEALLVLADMSKVWVWTDVPESKLNEVTVGSPARITTAASKAPFDGKVTHISPKLDPNTRTGRVRIEVANADGQLRPGMFAMTELSSASGGSTEMIITVPEAAVQTAEGGPAVFIPVDGEENTFAKTPVTVGKAAGGVVPVLSGLKEGDKVVTSGTFILKAELGKSGAAHEH